MPAEEQRSGGMRSGAHGGLMCPLEKGDRGIETSGSGYLRQQIRGGRKGRAERQGLGQSPNKITRLGGGIEIGKSSRGQPCCQPHVAQPTNS